MNLPKQGDRIVGLVRSLTCLSLLTIVATLGLVGWTLMKVREERTRAAVEQTHLDSSLTALREHVEECQSGLQAVLDETASLANQQDAAKGLTEFVRSQSGEQASHGVPLKLDQFDPLVTRLATFSRRAYQWRGRYDTVWQDVGQQRTMGRARRLIFQLRGTVETLEGRRRLDEAIRYKRWRGAAGEEADRQAQSILIEHARQESQGTHDFKSELAECARLVELLGGEEQFDNLADLKDNKLKPVLDRLRQAVLTSGPEHAEADEFTALTIEDLRTVLFGQGAGSNNAPAGPGGLFALRQDALRLRQERKRLGNDLAGLFQDIEAAKDVFVKSAHLRSDSLTHQMEQGLAAGCRRLILFGGGCSALFLWLALVISRGIRGQVRALELARAEAEQENAERRQAEEALRKNEAQLQTIVENLAEGVAVCDLNGQLLHFNQAALSMHGFRDLQETRRHLTEFADLFELSDMNGAALSVQQWPLSRILGGENLHDLDVRVRRLGAGWERVFSYGGCLVHDPSGRPLMAVVTISDITERKKAEAELEKAHKELLETSRMAGMAEVATGVLHNVGNVLNSVNVASTCVTDSLRKSKASNLSKVVALLGQHEADLGAFLTSDPKGKQIPGYLAQLADHLADEQATALKELTQLHTNIEHIKDIVTMQQSYAKVSGLTETLQVTELVEDALRMNSSALSRHDIRVAREFEPVPPLKVEKHKVLQILINLIRNAKYACDEAGRPDKRMTVRVAKSTDHVKIAVNDNGVGIPAQNLTRIFAHGFTTKKDGHGFGLHSGALAAKEMGGALTVQSDGIGCGATFTLELPLDPAVRNVIPAAATPQISA